MHEVASRLSVVVAMALGLGCASPKKLTSQQCDALVDRYTEIALRESFPDASAETIAAQKTQVRGLAQKDAALASCSAQITPAQHACAMAATTPDAFEACLSR